MRKTGEAVSVKLISTKDLSEMLDLSPRRVQQLAEEGVLVRAEKGKYKQNESIQRYIKHVQSRSHDDDVDYFAERAKHERAKREKAELQVAVMRGELHRAEDVEDVMTDMLAALRAKMLSLPAKIAPRLLGKNDLASAQDAIASEIHEALTELSNYDPAAFNRRNEDYVGPGGGEDEPE